MNCLKCGREIDAKDVFCPMCLEDMEKYPVKPGTAVHIPARKDEPAAPKPQPKKTQQVQPEFEAPKPQPKKAEQVQPELPKPEVKQAPAPKPVVEKPTPKPVAAVTAKPKTQVQPTFTQPTRHSILQM